MTENFAGFGWVLEVFAILLVTAIVRLASKVFLDRAQQRADQTHNLWDDALVHAGRRPLSLGIWVIGISFAAQIVGADQPAEIFSLVSELRDVAVVWILIWFSLRFIRQVELNVINGHHSVSVDKTTAAAVGKLLRAAITITGVLLVLQAFGFSISGVLAFGGIGGIAIGFAARDLLANFFGALMIFLDRPFSVGDWIRSPDRDIEGTVEDIGWRITRIRTFDKRPIYIPNSIFNSLTVENPSRMSNRRIYETLGLRYEDILQMHSIVNEVRQMLQDHPEIDQQQTLMVNFDAFGESAVEFFVYAFTKTTGWQAFHHIKQDVLLKIGEIVARHGAEMAFPTRTLHIQAEPEISE
ncbi:MAG: mechanosensitive ion channel family protein [Gammaproteobacteria bacterium TMED134]|nr:MAG: mechanosensitive ion channel family protein [Gammaproteobacteria bacterium TMED134]HBK17765.1 mechanosensitive ion channel protein MscS [Gammaproteobacteria bacterium]|tara:strand:+ start:4247 stop:5308 length:1062 start_codon:yes stop_codon:yes gene_type:complete